MRTPILAGNWKMNKTIAEARELVAQGVKEIVLVLAALKARGMSIILVEQNVALAAEASDRGYVMAVGEVVHEIGVGEWQGFLGDARLVQAYLGES